MKTPLAMRGDYLREHYQIAMINVEKRHVMKGSCVKALILQILHDELDLGFQSQEPETVSKLVKGPWKTLLPACF